jgi:DNA-binding NtrC family response regulator
MAEAVALIDDIFFQSKVAEAAKHLNVELKICAKPEAFAAEITNANPNLLIVDLSGHANAIDALVAAKAAVPDVPAVAFLPHVQTDLAERAKAVGGVEVMPRSKFTRDLATILARAKSQS